MLDINEAPEIGSAEAAVRSCVSLMAAVMGQREELLAYWCDLYYQVRAAYERERAPEPDPTVLRRGDLYPVLRELMADALKSAVRGEAKARCEKKAANRPSQSATPTALSEGASQERTDCHEPQGGSRNDVQEESESEDSDTSSAAAAAPSPQGEGSKLSGWAKKKKMIRDRLVQARAEGVTVAEIIEASDGALNDMMVIGMLNARKLKWEVYQLVEAALDTLGK